MEHKQHTRRASVHARFLFWHPKRVKTMTELPSIFESINRLRLDLVG